MNFSLPLANGQLVLENSIFSSLSHLLILDSFRNSRLFILTDENTTECCLPLLPEAIHARQPHSIRVKSGEDNKNLQTCEFIWNELSEGNADRHSILINLGGGMITDLGGFAASVYKRGISFIHIPTTLLGMVDASIGGKTGIDFRNIKNVVGTFTLPLGTFIYPGFLSTLSRRNKRSGIAEMIKHALVADAELWNQIRSCDEHYFYESESIQRSAAIKLRIVESDPYEKGVRKILNFGHTIGHALESWSLQHDSEPLSHGEAVAIGMLLETSLSVLMTGLLTNQASEIRNIILKFFPFYQIRKEQVDSILDRMREDKKNRNGKIGFSLLAEPGRALWDFWVDEQMIRQVLEQL